MSSNGPSDKYLHKVDDLKTAESVRLLLLRHRPRPCVYVYPIGPNEAPTGFEIKVASEWGTSPSEDFLLKLKQHLNENLPAD